MLAQYKRGSGNSHVVNIVFLGATVTGISGNDDNKPS